MKKDKYNTHDPQHEDSRCGFMRDKANGKKKHEHGAGHPEAI